MSQNRFSLKISTITNNQNIQHKYNINTESHKRSLSTDISIDSVEPRIISKKYKKIKLILKRPQNPKIINSASPKRNPNRIMTFQKTPKHEINIIYNRKLHSERNKIHFNRKEFINKLSYVKLPLFKITESKKQNNKEIILIFVKKLNKIILNLKKVFFNKIKYYNKIYTKKNIIDNINTNNYSLHLPHLSNSKNFLEENALDNKTILYKNKSNNNNNNSNEIDNILSSENDSFDKNLTIISKAEIKKLNDSNSDSQEEINNENSINNGNYSYDKKDININQHNFLIKDVKDELEINSHNKEIISNIKNKLNKESLLFSEGKIHTINKSENNIKINNKKKEIKVKNIKRMKIHFTPNINNIKKQKQKLFIDNIPFDKIEINNIFESANNYSKNKELDFMKSNTNTINNTNITNNIINYNLKNKNMKDNYENTFNSVEETTNFIDYENNPINKVNYEDEKIIFNNTNSKNADFEIINNKLLNNSNDIINLKENVIEKSGELFYPVDDSINLNINNNINNNLLDNNEEELDINDENKFFSEYRIVDKSKRLISFLSNQNATNNNNDNKSFRAQITLNTYYNIIKKIIPKKNSLNNDKENLIIENEIINKKNRYNVSFSIRSYETFIKQLMDEISKENNNNYICDKKDIMRNDIRDFENKIKNLKNCVLFLLVKKHYLKTSKEKLKLISEKNPQIDNQKIEIFDQFQKIKNKNKKDDIPMLLHILKDNRRINKRDIKLMKKFYKKEKTKIEKEDKTTLNYSSLIIPLFYISKFFSAFQKV